MITNKFAEWSYWASLSPPPIADDQTFSKAIECMLKELARGPSDCQSDFAPEFEPQVQNILSVHVKECVLPIIRNHCVRIGAELSEHVDALDAKFKKGMRFVLQEICNLNSSPL